MFLASWRSITTRASRSEGITFIIGFDGFGVRAITKKRPFPDALASLFMVQRAPISVGLSNGARPACATDTEQLKSIIRCGFEDAFTSRA
jgi:hypothetical protein